MNRELPDVQAGFRKGRATRDQIANIRWIMEKAREFQKNIYFCFIDYANAFDCVDHNKLWKILKEMGIPDHLTCLLRNLYTGQEATVRTGHATTDWFQIGKEVCQGCILSPCLFNLYAEYIMRISGLGSQGPTQSHRPGLQEQSQAGGCRASWPRCGPRSDHRAGLTPGQGSAQPGRDLPNVRGGAHNTGRALTRGNEEGLALFEGALVAFVHLIGKKHLAVV